MFPEKLVLSAADYAIFGATLAISAAIGIYFQFANKKKTSEEYLLAGKDMSLLPVSFSLMATFMSATTLMGIPAEMYLYGTNMAFMNIGFVIGVIISSYVFLPIFFAINVSTAYEYLEKRFGKSIRKIVSGIFALQMLFFTGATLYAPALALSAVTNLPMWISIVSVGIVCTFYCSLGGMKAVLWADTMQAVLMLLCLFSVIIKGCLDLGGISKIFEAAADGGRLIVPKFSVDFTAHYTMFNVVLQAIIITTSSYGGSQVQVQRLMTVKNLKRSRMANFLSAPMLVVFHLMCCLCGLVCFAYFKSCDPLSAPNKPIHAPDQILPYFITSSMHLFPGLPGLCVAGIFSASLSTVSSTVNSLAAITSEDFLRPFFPKVSRNVTITKVLSLFYGLLCIALSFIMASLGNLIRVTIIFYGMVAGPNLGVFLLAACTKTTNEEGAIIGTVVGVIVAACLSFIPGTIIDPPLPLSNECPGLQNLSSQSVSTSTFPHTTWNFSTTTMISTTSQTQVHDSESFHLAYMWISTIALLTCLLVGFIASVISRKIRGSYEGIPDIYLSPVRVFFIKQKIKEKEITEPEIKKTITSADMSTRTNSKCNDTTF